MKMYFLPYKWKHKWGFVGMLVQNPLPVLDMIGYGPECWEYTEHLQCFLQYSFTPQNLRIRCNKYLFCPSCVSLDNEVIFPRRKGIEADSNTSCVVTQELSVFFFFNFTQSTHYSEIRPNLIWSLLGWNLPPYAALKGHRSKVRQSSDRKYHSSMFAPRPNVFREALAGRGCVAS